VAALAQSLAADSFIDPCGSGPTKPDKMGNDNDIEIKFSG